MTLTPSLTEDIQRIDLRNHANGIEFSWPITLHERSRNPLTGQIEPKSISTVTISLGLGDDDDPPQIWYTPGIDTSGADSYGLAAGVANCRTTQLLIGAAIKPAVGLYRLYSAVGDGSERIVRKHYRIEIVGP